MLSALLDAPLIAGPLPTAISVTGFLAGLGLLLHRSRRWWTRWVPAAVAAAVGTAVAAAAAAEVWQPFPDPLPPRVLVWIGVFVGVCVLGVGRGRAGWRARLLAVATLLAVLLTCLVKVNAFYGYRPTLNAALGLPAANQVDVAQLPVRSELVTAAPGIPLARRWHSPPGMPGTGRIATVTVPGARSGFAGRPAWLYLPPAYLGSVRARLPVLVLIPGQPGGPRDWLLAGKLAQVADAFAAAHAGLAPVIVVPDATGSAMANTLCLDSRLGAAESYLAEDVPAWLAKHLQVAPSPLAIGGFSFGGTCALQLAVRRPDVYSTFLDISGQVQPTLGDPAGTVRSAFGGDRAAFDRVDPMTELQSARLPGTAGVIAVGRDDAEYRPQAERVAGLCRSAGMTVGLQEFPGAHSWTIASSALAGALAWIGGRLELFDPVPPPTAP